jgi:hypothetical protein
MKKAMTLAYVALGAFIAWQIWKNRPR